MLFLLDSYQLLDLHFSVIAFAESLRSCDDYYLLIFTSEHAERQSFAKIFGKTKFQPGEKNRTFLR